MNRQAAYALADRRGARMVVQCAAQGTNDSWEAFCIDFDLAVQGSSFEEVRDSLNKAIVMYIEAAVAEKNREDRVRLLTRRAPFWVRMKWAMRGVRAMLKNRKPGDPHQEVAMGFQVECPA